MTDNQYIILFKLGGIVRESAYKTELPREQLL